MKNIILIVILIVNTNKLYSQFGLQNIIDSNVIGVTSIASADLNQDGFVDIITSQNIFQNDKISYFLNSGLSNFGEEQIISANVFASQSVAAGNLTNDSWPDIVAISETISASVLWYPNSNGTFPTEIIIDTNIQFPEDVKIADIDNNGTQDIIVLGHFQLSVHYNDGFGNFTKAIIDENTFEFYDFDISDIDNDGFKDIIVGSGDVLVYKNNMGTFSLDLPRTNSIINTGLTFLIYLNDFDMDGDNDLVIDGNSNNEIRWYANDGNGFFNFSQTIETTIQCKSITSKDFDNDGDNDLLVPLWQEGEIVWYENIGTGNFAQKQIISNGITAHTVVVHSFDINNDNTFEPIWAHNFSFNLNDFPLSLDRFKVNSVELFPNPSNGIIHVKSKKQSSLNVYDTSGKLIYENLIINIGSNLIDINLTPQLYYFEFKIENSISLKKIIIN